MNRQLIYILIAILGLTVAFFTTSAHFDIKSVGVLVFFLVFIPTLIKPDIGFIIIVVSALFSPDMILGATSAREITVRIEDVFLLVVILAWFLRSVFTKNIYSAFQTKITGPFFAYIFVCILSTIFAAVFNQIDLAHSFFVILKYLEYFLLFLIVKDNIKTLKQAKIFVVVFFLTAFFVSIHANVYIHEQITAGSQFFRTAPPVATRAGGEAGTLGGYLLFMMAIASGLLLHLRAPILKVILMCLLGIMGRAFIYTLSRGSYIAFVLMVIAFIFFSRKIILVYITAAIAALLMVTMPQMARDRITQTAAIREDASGRYVELEESPRDRLESWKLVLSTRFPASPLFGHGVAKFFIDGQFFLILCETGLAGLALFICVLVGLFKEAKRILTINIVKNDQFGSGLSLGFLAGFVGLLTQAISTNTFIIIRIMEPFWFMAAIVFSLPDLLERKKETAENAPA